MASETSPAEGAESPSDQLIDDASEWIGISTAPHRFNAVEFNLDDYEVGHVHQGGTLDINFPRRMRDALIEEGSAEEHHYVPESGWTTYRMNSTEDLDGGRWLLRVSYLYRALTQRNNPTGEEILENVDIAAELDELEISDSVREIFENVAEIEQQ